MRIKNIYKRNYKDNIKLAVSTASIAGMVNVSSLILFFSFTSNVTGHYAILAEEISKGKWFQVLIVFIWIFLFFLGSFFSNFLKIINDYKNRVYIYFVPLIIEFICLIIVGVYGQFFYKETLMETEILVAVLLFSMGIQNGFTASVSNIKSTHLTGLTTDLGLYLSEIVTRNNRKNRLVKEKFEILASIALSYLLGAILAGSVVHWFQFKVFYFISVIVSLVALYEYYRLKIIVKEDDYN